MNRAEINERFESADMLLEGIVENLARLDRVDEEFAKSRPISADWVPAGNFQQLQIKIVGKPPSAMRRLAYTILNDLRNSLDHGLVAATKAIVGKRPKTGIHFPFAENAQDFEDLFKHRRYQGIPEQLRPLLKSMEPWPRVRGRGSGNDLLKNINVLAQPNKHEIALSIKPDYNSYTLNFVEGCVGFGDLGNFDFPELGDDGVTTLLTMKPGLYPYDLNIKWYVAIAEEGRYKRFNLRSILGSMYPTAQVAIDRLKNETERLLR